MILELFGSPGAGKTYAINQIYPGAVKERGKKIVFLIEPIKTLVKFCITLTPYAYKIRRTIWETITDLKIDSPRYKPVKINDFVWNISMLGSVYKFFRGNVYMDEGIVHRTISMCINYGIKKEICCKIIDNLSFVIKNVVAFFLDVSKDECLDSIMRRNRHTCSIDELRGKKLNDFLEAYAEYCNYVCNTFHFKKLSRNDIVKVEV